MFFLYDSFQKYCLSSHVKLLRYPTMYYHRYISESYLNHPFTCFSVLFRLEPNFVITKWQVQYKNYISSKITQLDSCTERPDEWLREIIL